MGYTDILGTQCFCGGRYKREFWDDIDGKVSCDSCEEKVDRWTGLEELISDMVKENPGISLHALVRKVQRRAKLGRKLVQDAVGRMFRQRRITPKAA